MTLRDAPPTRHETPFSRLHVRWATGEIPMDFYRKWVLRIFGTGPWCDAASIRAMIDPIRHEITLEVASDLLSLAQYRARFVGGSFVGLLRMEPLEEEVGKLLLRSDGPYSGFAFVVALARLNTRSSRQFLCDYLDYYLTRRDLDFEQPFVLAALEHLDGKNGTRLHESFLDRWNEGSRGSRYDPLPDSRRFFARMFQANETVGRSWS
jgi:hypothetical protein